MAKKSAQSAFSFKKEAQIDVGLWQGGECVVKDIGFCTYDYGGNIKRDLPIVLLVVLQHAEGTYEQPYGIGDGWELPKSDKNDLAATIIPTKGQTGFPKTCNASYFFNSLDEAKYDLGALDGDDGVKALVGQGLVVNREPQPERKSFKNDRRGDDTAKPERTFLLVREVLEDAPEFGKAEKKAQAASAKGKAQEPDDDETPVRKGKSAKPNGAATLDDEAKAALMEVLDHNDGQLAIADLEEAVFTHLRKHPHKKDIAELCGDADWLDDVEGITVNKKKGIVALEA